MRLFSIITLSIILFSSPALAETVNIGGGSTTISSLSKKGNTLSKSTQNRTSVGNVERAKKRKPTKAELRWLRKYGTRAELREMYKARRARYRRKYRKMRRDHRFRMQVHSERLYQTPLKIWWSYLTLFVTSINCRSLNMCKMGKALCHPKPTTLSLRFLGKLILCKHQHI